MCRVCDVELSYVCARFFFCAVLFCLQVRPGTNAALRAYHAVVEECEQELEVQLSDCVRALGLDSGKVKKLDNPMHGWCFKVTRKDEVSLRGAHYHTLETRKDGVYFTSKELREAGKALKDAQQA